MNQRPPIRRAFFLSAVLFAVSLFINFWANNYATEAGKNPLTDIVLNNVPVFDVNWLMTWGVLALLIFIGVILTIKPDRIPFVLKSISLFIIIRSVFISITHIAQFQPQALLDSGTFFNFIGSGNSGGLFFSGHTGLPFLLALIFWKNVWMRTIFLAASIIFGAGVLLGHLHYSIDVLGAFFITYTIYRMAVMMFKKDFALFQETV